MSVIVEKRLNFFGRSRVIHKIPHAYVVLATCTSVFLAFLCSLVCSGSWTTYIHTYIHTLHYITLHYITLHYITLHYITLHYITLHYITLHYITLHYITLHYITLHYITSHHITLHYITYIHTVHIHTYVHACTFLLGILCIHVLSTKWHVWGALEMIVGNGEKILKCKMACIPTKVWRVCLYPLFFQGNDKHGKNMQNHKLLKNTKNS